MPLNFAERYCFEQSLRHPSLFRNVIRPALYRRNGNDPEKVHECVLELLQDSGVMKILDRSSYLFDNPVLDIPLNGEVVRPFGTAAGVDKNGDALVPFSRIYGFQEPGTVVMPKRDGNKRPRVAVDNKRNDLYNAQGFPSFGKEYFLGNIIEFRVEYPDYPVYASICGLPLSEEKAVDMAMAEMETLLAELNPYIDGSVWNPFSPNTAALAKLRTPNIFRETAELMKRRAGGKLRLVKMGPYEPAEKRQWLGLVNGFLEGGGHGVVAVNTKMFAKEQVPSAEWGYPSAGRSGAFLRDYRLRAVSDTREAFPEAVIFAAGGIFDGDDAYETFKLGATALESYTPETFYGPGLVAQKQQRVEERLLEDGYETLEDLQIQARKWRKLLSDLG